MDDVQIKDQEGVFKLIVDNDDLSWQSILYELVRTNQMDPWDIDVSVLAKKYMEMVRQLKQTDLRISGKMVLAATVLLKMKSNKLLGADLDYLDSLFAQHAEDSIGEEFSDEFAELPTAVSEERYTLIPRTPQARRRKVSIYDLIDALQKAMEVKKRRVMRELPPLNLEPPERGKDITEIIREVYGRIKAFFIKNKSNLKFSQLIPSDSKEDKVFTFIPLLHLTNARKIDLFQEQHFGEIEIAMLQSKKEIDKQLGAGS